MQRARRLRASGEHYWLVITSRRVAATSETSSFRDGRLANSSNSEDAMHSGKELLGYCIDRLVSKLISNVHAPLDFHVACDRWHFRSLGKGMHEFLS